jgi:hypothetical protein
LAVNNNDQKGHKRTAAHLSSHQRQWRAGIFTADVSGDLGVNLRKYNSDASAVDTFEYRQPRIPALSGMRELVRKLSSTITT